MCQPVVHLQSVHLRSVHVRPGDPEVLTASGASRPEVDPAGFPFATAFAAGLSGESGWSQRIVGADRPGHSTAIRRPAGAVGLATAPGTDLFIYRWGYTETGF